MYNKLISASIVLYNNEEAILKEAINSFLNTDLNIVLYLIDHSPNDNLKNINISEKVFYIHNPLNPGFGAGHNVAINKIIDTSSYHLVLNPDVYFERGTIEKLISFMEINMDVGLVMPKVLYPDGNIQYLCKTEPTLLDMFIRSFMPGVFKSFFKNRIMKYEYRDKNYEQIMFDIPYLSGCFMFLRSDVLKRIGGFDERYFLHMEDADLSRKFNLYSKTAYFPNSCVYHHFGQLTHKKLKYKIITIKSAIKYFNKWGWN
jgi:GT2 family glycosyltransferase